MKAKSVLNFTEIKRILTESAVNPNTPGKWKMIADMNDHNYFVKRAIECLYESEINNPDENLKTAITLLAMARILKQNEGK